MEDLAIVVCAKHWDEVMNANREIISAGVKGASGQEADIGFARFRFGQRIEFHKDAPNCPICHKGAV